MTDANGETTPRRWPRRVQILALIGLATLPVAALGTRFGVWHYSIGLRLFGVGLLLVVVLALVGIVALLALRKRLDPQSRASLQVAVGVAAAVGFLLFSHIHAAFTTPPIHQVSTDVRTPPEFVTIRRLRAPDTNSLALTTEVIEMQREAYPWIQTQVYPTEIETAFETAVQVLEEMGLEIVATRAGQGIAEATATSFWFGFVDDVVVRVAPASQGVRIDARSASRVGQGDLGANADRVAEFFRRYEIEAGLEAPGD